jgi:Flp pilus assembly protein TadG
VITIIEFGRAFMITNMLTHSARDGARVGAVLSTTNRQGGGSRCLNSTGVSAVCSRVRTQLLNVMSQSDVSGMTITVSQPCSGGSTPVVKVLLTGTLNYLFYGATFGVTRSVTFEDEGVPPGAAACTDCGTLAACPAA